MYCPNCGAKNEDSTLFRSKCGIKLMVAETQGNPHNEEVAALKPEKKGFTQKQKLIAGISAITLIICIGGGIYADPKSPKHIYY
jgi:uncharacterized membrane protein YvbJ